VQFLIRFFCFFTYPKSSISFVFHIKELVYINTSTHSWALMFDLFDVQVVEITSSRIGPLILVSLCYHLFIHWLILCKFEIQKIISRKRRSPLVSNLGLIVHLIHLIRPCFIVVRWLWHIAHIHGWSAPSKCLARIL